MKQLFLAGFIISFIAMNAFGQQKSKKKKNCWLVSAGPDFQLILQQYEYMAPKVNVGSINSLLGPTIKPQFSFFAEAHYLFWIGKGLFLETGANYINRKTHTIYNVDSIVKYILPDNPNPTIETWNADHNIEVPFIFGIVLGDAQLGAGMKYIVIINRHEKSKQFDGSIENKTFGTSEIPLRAVPTLIFRYNLNKPDNLKANINFDFRNKYHLDIGLGISYAFNIMK